MFCVTCGQHLPDDARFCHKCGAPQRQEKREDGRLPNAESGGEVRYSLRNTSRAGDSVTYIVTNKRVCWVTNDNYKGATTIPLRHILRVDTQTDGWGAGTVCLYVAPGRVDYLQVDTIAHRNELTRAIEEALAVRRLRGLP